MKTKIIIPIAFGLLFLFSCAIAEPNKVKITNFEECLAAGNKALRSYPGRCYLPDGTMFEQKVDKSKLKKLKISNTPKNFDDCVKMGFPVMRSMPPKCSAGTDLVFVKEIPDNHLAANATVDVQSFEECKKAGYLIKAGSPDQCITPEKIVFFAEKASQAGPICEDLCGDGECQEMVCMAEGCPCAETIENCKEDCQ